MNRWKLTGCLLLAVAAGLGVWVVVAWRTEQGQVNDARICHHVNVLDNALVTILNRSLAALPANPYYRRHPAELTVALENTHYALARIEAARC